MSLMDRNPIYSGMPAEATASVPHDRSYPGWEQDPLGQALLAYRAGYRAATVHTWSDLEEWDELPASRFFRAGAAMPRLEREALAACRGSVLDLGAGAGCHALTLQRRGLAVTALDQSEGACRVMRDRGIVDVRKGDWRAFGGSRYDTVLSLMNGLGLAGDLAGLDAFLDAASGWLAPGGQLLVDSADLIYLYTVEHGGLYEDMRKAHYGEAVYRMHYGEARGPSFGWLFLDFPTLQRRAALRGWQASRLHEGPFYAYLACLTRA